jgi:hypothetical protein
MIPGQKHFSVVIFYEAAGAPSRWDRSFEPQLRCGEHSHIVANSPSFEWIEFRCVSPCQVLNRILTSTPHVCCRWQGPGPLKIS